MDLNGMDDFLVQDIIEAAEPLDGSFMAIDHDEEIETDMNNNETDVHQSIDSSTKYECVHCGNDFSCKSNLKRHERTHVVKLDHQCSKCSLILASEDELKEHIISAHKKSYLCTECGKWFAQKTNMNKHIKIKHPDSVTCNGMQKAMACPVAGCTKTFVHRGKFQDHMNRHSGIKPHTCRKCSKVFANRYDRNYHEKVCTGEKIIQCDICNGQFSSQRVLEQHYSAQHENSSFTCADCNKNYRYETSLRRHRRKKHPTS